ncbi:hypothetical protein HDU96_004849 [Phlyctochytrium bullatum]|nr:hypothetical protein HDU96_004849 [Phlyctochytrium bullatum]
MAPAPATSTPAPAAGHGCSRTPENGFCCGKDERIPVFAQRAREAYFYREKLEPKWTDEKYQPVFLYNVETRALEYTFIGPRLGVRYVALSHLWRHNVFPELLKGDIASMTRADRDTFSEKCKAVIKEVDPSVTHVWVDQLCVDQQDKEAIRAATYVMSYVYEWAESTVVCLPGVQPEEELQQWLSSTWTMQELLYSSRIEVYLLQRNNADAVSDHLEEIAMKEVERCRDMRTNKDKLIVEMLRRKGGWPLDKLYAVRHTVDGLRSLPCTYDRDVADLLYLLSEDGLVQAGELMKYFWLFGLEHGPLHTFLHPGSIRHVHPVKGFSGTLRVVSPWSHLERLQLTPRSQWQDGDLFVLFVAPALRYGRKFYAVSFWVDDFKRFEAEEERFAIAADLYAKRDYFGKDAPPKYDYKTLDADRAKGLQAALKATMARWDEIESKYPGAKSAETPADGDDEEDNPTIRRIMDIISLHMKTHPNVQSVDWSRTLAIDFSANTSEGVLLVEGTPDPVVGNWVVSRVTRAEQKLADALTLLTKHSKCVFEDVWLAAKKGSEALFDRGVKPVESKPAVATPPATPPSVTAAVERKPPASSHGCDRKPENGFCCGMDERIPVFSAAARAEYFDNPNPAEPKWVDKKYQPVFLFSLETGKLEYTFVGPRLQKRYIAISHLWRHKIFPELKDGDLDSLTPSDRSAFLIKARAIAASVDKDLKYIWLDQMCVDQKNKETVRAATYVMSYVYEWAQRTVVCLPGAKPDEELKGWLSSTWTMQELLYSKNLSVHLGAGANAEVVKRLGARANEEAQRCQAMQGNPEALIREMRSRLGGWPLDKLYAIRHTFEGLASVPCTYDRDLTDVLTVLIEDQLCKREQAVEYFFLFGLPHGPLYRFADRFSIKSFHPEFGCVVKSDRVLSPWSDPHRRHVTPQTEWKEGDEFVLLVAPLLASEEGIRMKFNFTGEGDHDVFSGRVETFEHAFGELTSWFTGETGFGLGYRPEEKYDLKKMGAEKALKATLDRWDEILGAYEYVGPEAGEGQEEVAEEPTEEQAAEEPAEEEAAEEHTDEQAEDEEQGGEGEDAEEADDTEINPYVSHVQNVISYHLRLHPTLQRVDWNTTVAIKVSVEGNSAAVLLTATPSINHFDVEAWEVTHAAVAEGELQKILSLVGRFTDKIESSVLLTAENKGVDLFAEVWKEVAAMEGEKDEDGEDGEEEEEDE